MRRFFCSILLFIAPVIIVFAPAYYIYAVQVKPYQLGDLEKLGGYVIPRSNNSETFQIDTTKYYTDIIDLYNNPQNRVDDTIKITASVVNFGDSFGCQKEKGYVNYLGKISGYNILNVSSPITSSFDSAISMLNNDDLNSVYTRYVIIEIIERYIVDRILDLDINLTETIPSRIRYYKINEEECSNTRPNFKEVFNWILLKIKNNPALKSSLNKILFSHSGDVLHFYFQDLNMMSVDHTTMNLVEKKLLLINEMFAAKGIKLIVLCVPDKYDAYQDYIQDNKYGHKTVLDQLSQLDSCTDILYNAKDVTSILINDGVKDVFLYNDTHWSPIAAQAVGQDLARRLTKSSPDL